MIHPAHISQPVIFPICTHTYTKEIFLHSFPHKIWYFSFCHVKYMAGSVLQACLQCHNLKTCIYFPVLLNQQYVTNNGTTQPHYKPVRLHILYVLRSSITCLSIADNGAFSFCRFDRKCFSNSIVIYYDKIHLA